MKERMIMIRIKTVIIQNLILILGIVCIYEFLSLKTYFGQVESWMKYKQPIIDGEGIGITFLGLPINDDGVHWTQIMGYANTFLIIGIVLVLLSLVLLFWKTFSNKKSNAL
jgi:hypothetical protein